MRRPGWTLTRWTRRRLRTDASAAVPGAHCCDGSPSARLTEPPIRVASQERCKRRVRGLLVVRLGDGSDGVGCSAVAAAVGA